MRAHDDCRRTAAPQPEVTLSADEARRIALRAQGLLGAPDRRGGVRGVLRHLGAVQLDTISVLARSHELVPYARLGAVGRDGGRARPTGAARHAFEYWSHAACVLPIEEWPHFAFRRRAYRARATAGHELPDGAPATTVLDAAAGRGPADRHRAGRRQERRPVVGLVRDEDRGRVAAGHRRGGLHRAARLEAGLRPGRARRPGRAAARRPGRRGVPAPAGRGWPGQSLGVATRADLADYHRLKGEQVDAVIADSGLVPVDGRGLGQAGLGRSRGAGDRAARPAPHDPAVAVRLAGLGPGAHRADLRLHPPAGGVRAPSPSGCTATSRCRCWPAAGWSAGSTRPARARTLVARQVSLDGPKAVAPMAEALRGGGRLGGLRRGAGRAASTAPEPARGPSPRCAAATPGR